MTDPVLHGAPRSNYVRTARITLAEKGVAYDYDPAMPQSDEQLARHPWGKIPALTHGDLALYETLAVCRYVDEAFDGPALQPADAAGRARMSQWISVYNAYVDPPVLRHIVIHRSFRNPPNEELVAAGIPDAETALGVLETALADTPYLAGADVSLADFFPLPALDYLAKTPEGETILANTPNVKAWMARMMEREAVQAVLEG